MEKIYKFERKSNLLVSVISAILFGSLIAFFATRPEFAVLNQGNSYIGILLLILLVTIFGLISFLPLIVAVTGFLKLKDGVLSRTYLGIKIWSLNVPEISDIYFGNTAGADYPNQMTGLSFRANINGTKWWKQAPYTILNMGELITDLVAINSNIQVHSDFQDLKKFWGWPV